MQWLKTIGWIVVAVLAWCLGMWMWSKRGRLGK